MNKLVAVLMLSLACLLSGCSTVPNEATGYDETQIRQPGEGKGILVFYRAFAPPTAYDMHVYINDVKVASLPNEGFSWVELDLGWHKVKVDWTNWSGMPSAHYDVNLQPGGENYLELSKADNVAPLQELLFYNRYRVEKDENEKAVQHERAKIQKCCRYVPADVQSL